MSEKRHDPRCQIFVTCTVFGPLWTLKIFQNHTTIDKEHMFAFFVDNRLLKSNIAKQRLKLTPQNDQNANKIRPSKSFIVRHGFWKHFGTEIVQNMIPKLPPNPPKWHPWALRGAPGRVMGSQKCPYADLGVILVSKMTSKWQTMTPKWQNMTPTYTAFVPLTPLGASWFAWSRTSSL